ncbi:FAD binding domain-containing protein [Lentinula aff. lateritia]|uniref:FAD binding domain-containing protein n=1 Tax=Lentinula aff. lateritia TaxID=2804960 RepID=A0ACC1TU79_9AGAR|nr:FAD binding domain-containing protein [Lentinula aff. lateritia]
MNETRQNLAVPIKHIEVLIIGGGPAGSYAASVLSREGIDVAVLESTKFPRCESLIPSVRPYLRFIGAEEKIVQHGFTKKPGSAIKFNQFKREGYTDFVALGADNNAWNVIRSEFDHLLLNHARECGAKVYEETKVTDIAFDTIDPEKPVSVSWTRTCTAQSPDASQNGTTKAVHGSTTFTHLIDASGRAGLLSTRYLKNRHFNESLKNIAVWGYWRNRSSDEKSDNEHNKEDHKPRVGMYGKGTSREGAPWFEALKDESGWAWFIPLHNGKTSVGIVMNQEQYNAKAKSNSSSSDPQHECSLVGRYLVNLRLAPGVARLLCGKDVVLNGSDSEHEIQTPIEEEILHQQAKLEPGSVRSASDFSYSAPNYAGKGFRIVGDAGAFIDPFFSSGIHLAFTGALSAAATICASRRGNCTEVEAAMWHTKRVAVSYTRFQVVVLSAYKQMRAQSVDVLSDVDEDNFDRAFTYLRPVIQGASDMGSRLSESELQRSLDFCINLFNPTSPEEHKAVEGQLAGLEKYRELMDVTKPVVDPKSFDNVLKMTSSTECSARSTERFECKETEANAHSESKPRMVLDKINARRLVHPEYAINNLEAEELLGCAIRLEKGHLGLVKVALVR